jgi:exo-beta-1,3-glucanase (GH17 family)
VIRGLGDGADDSGSSNSADGGGYADAEVAAESDDAAPQRPDDAGSILTDAGAAEAPKRRTIASGVLARRGISYSGYRENQAPGGEVPTEAQITEDLQLIVKAGYGRIRLFDAGPHAERVLEVIEQESLDLKVQLGLWMIGPDSTNSEGNHTEAQHAARLALLYPGIVAMLSVGNNTISDLNMLPEDLAMYVALLRTQVTQPVGFDEQARALIANDAPKLPELYDAADFIGVQLMQFTEAVGDTWNWRQLQATEDKRARAMMNAAMAYVKAQFTAAQQSVHKYAPDIVMTLDETGWKDTTMQVPNLNAGQIESYMAHPVNQLWMVDALEAWVYGDGKDKSSPVALTMFEAFDEPWKGDDDHWGLFDVNRNAKYVLWSHVAALKPAGAITPAESSAVYYKP